MRLSISQITTVTQSFADDLDAYCAAGADGIGIWEMKLEDDSLDRFQASGLALCIRTYALVEPGDCLGHIGVDV